MSNADPKGSFRLRPVPKPAAHRAQRPTASLRPGAAKPAVQPPAPPAATAPKTIAGVHPVHIVIVVLVVVGLATWAINEALVKPMAQKPGDIVVTVPRDSAEAPFQVAIEDLLGTSSANYRKYVDEGKGLKIVFSTTGHAEEYEALAPSPDGDPDANLRTQEVEQARAKLVAYVAKLNAPPPARVIKFAVFVDKTAGIDDVLKSQIQFNLNADNIDENTRKGDEVRILFHRLTATPFFNLLGPVVVQAKANNGSGQEKIAEIRDQLLADTRQEGNSALATGMFNALREDKVVSGDRVIVFSDGFENDPSTISFERLRRIPNKFTDPAVLADARNWPEIQDRMQATVKAPDLTGVRIDWYLPARPEDLPRMRAAILIWNDLLTKKGANFQEHF